MNTSKIRSVKVFLSAIVAGIVAVLTIGLIIVSYNIAFTAIEGAYLNQLKNFNDRINAQIADFMEQQTKLAVFFSKNQIIVEGASSGNYAKIRPLLREYFNETGIYENVFVSTAEEDPMLMATGIGKGEGLRFGNMGYDDAIAANLKGNAAISNVQKSPITGLPVCLVSAPIKVGNRIVGIFGLPINIGTYSQNIISDLKIGKTGYPFVTDAKGTTFAHPVKENIFKLNVKDYDWGKQMFTAPSGSLVHYQWQGKDKILIFSRNEKYPFISALTMYFSDIQDDALNMAYLMIIFGLVGIAIAVAGILFFITRKLEPLNECKDVITSMSKGDFSVRYTGKITNDEFGDLSQALNTSADNLEKLVAEIVMASQNLVRAVEEIASGNENLSQRTSEQASSLEEIAATVEETNASTRQNAGNATEANTLAEKSSRLAIDGGEIVEKAVLSIGEINNASKKISEIITMINEIAFQTNLLALNAAVEAARAGDQGRGFAVVAGEVRNLSQRSAGAAKQIGELIKDSITKIDEGTLFVNKSGDALKDIINSAKQVKDIISEIAASSDEQSRGIDQINIAVTEMDTMTQQNAALVEQTAAASEEMSNQAQELLSMVQQFKIREDISMNSQISEDKNIHLRNLQTKLSQKKETAAIKAAPAKKETPAKTENIVKPARSETKPDKYDPEKDGYEKF